MKEKEVKLAVKDTKTKVCYYKLKGEVVKTFVASFDKRKRVLSTREGYKEVLHVANHYTSPPLWDYMHQNFNEHIKQIFSKIDIEPESIALLATGADMDNLSVKTETYEDLTVCCVATAGARGNALRAGTDVAGYPRTINKNPGTINTLLFTSASLKDGPMAKALITITEAKTAALLDLKIPSTYTPKNQATGTGTDNIIIIPGDGYPESYTGGHSKIGELIGKAVKAAVTEALIKQDGISLKYKR